MHLSYRLSSNKARLILRGEIDLATGGVLGAALDEMLDCPGTVTLVDLRHVSFLDCHGIGLLIAASQIARGNGQQLIVTHPRGLVRTILTVTDVLPQLSAPRAQRHRLRVPSRHARPPRG